MLVDPFQVALVPWRSAKREPGQFPPLPRKGIPGLTGFIFMSKSINRLSVPLTLRASIRIGAKLPQSLPTSSHCSATSWKCLSASNSA